MKEGNYISSQRIRELIIQALIDAAGYPKSEENKKQIEYSSEQLKTLTDKLLKNDDLNLDQVEKRMVLNSLGGALDYVGSDIPSLYDISEQELKKFKDSLEKNWSMTS